MSEDKAVRTKDFPHANPRQDLRQWSVILMAAGFIAYFAPSVSGGAAPWEQSLLLLLVGFFTWAVASYAPVSKLMK